jgi:hypothetical protein
LPAKIRLVRLRAFLLPRSRSAGDAARLRIKDRRAALFVYPARNVPRRNREADRAIAEFSALAARLAALAEERAKRGDGPPPRRSSARPVWVWMAATFCAAILGMVGSSREANWDFCVGTRGNGGESSTLAERAFWRPASV